MQNIVWTNCYHNNNNEVVDVKVMDAEESGRCQDTEYAGRHTALNFALQRGSRFASRENETLLPPPSDSYNTVKMVSSHLVSCAVSPKANTGNRPNPSRPNLLSCIQLGPKAHTRHRPFARAPIVLRPRPFAQSRTVSTDRSLRMFDLLEWKRQQNWSDKI